MASKAIDHISAVIPRKLPALDSSNHFSHFQNVQLIKALLSFFIIFYLIFSSSCKNLFA